MRKNAQIMKTPGKTNNLKTKKLKRKTAKDRSITTCLGGNVLPTNTNKKVVFPGKEKEPTRKAIQLHLPRVEVSVIICNL